MFDHLRRRKRRRNPLFPVFVIVVVLAGAGGGFLGVQALAELGVAQQIAEKVTPSPTVTPTPVLVAITEAGVTHGVQVAPEKATPTPAVARTAQNKKKNAAKRRARRGKKARTGAGAITTAKSKGVAARTPESKRPTPTPASEMLSPGDLPEGLGGPNAVAVKAKPVATPPVDLKKRNIQPVALYFPAPNYPELAKKHNLEGQVVVEIVVNREGLVKDATVVKSQPPFDQEALRSIMMWKFKPVVLEGEPVVWKYRLAMRFTPTT